MVGRKIRETAKVAGGAGRRREAVESEDDGANRKMRGESSNVEEMTDR